MKDSERFDTDSRPCVKDKVAAGAPSTVRRELTDFIGELARFRWKDGRVV